MEKERKRIEKLEKQALAEQQKIIKPGECMKVSAVPLKCSEINSLPSFSVRYSRN